MHPAKLKQERFWQDIRKDYFNYNDSQALKQVDQRGCVQCAHGDCVHSETV